MSDVDHPRKHLKRRQAALALALVLALGTMAFGLAQPQTALAWDDCPLGLTNDPYPGECRRYVDTNNDGICDRSQSQPAATTTTELAPPAPATTVAAAGEPPTGDCPLGPCVGCGVCFGVPLNGASATPTADLSLPLSTSSQDGGSPLMTHYLVSPIAIAFFLIYSLSFVLYKTRRMRVTTHRKIWNVLLLATFLITGIFGLILTIQLDYELPFQLPFNLLFWHVEAGIVMTLISFFHLGWHLNYYRNLLRSRAHRSVEKRRSGHPELPPDRAQPEPGSRANRRSASPGAIPRSANVYRQEALPDTE